MNTNARQTKGACAAYQQRIVEMLEENKPLHTFPDLNNHINSCKNCMTFFKTLTNISESMGTDISQRPAAPGAVLRHTLAYMEIKKSRFKKRENVWDYFSNLLQYRIPVYQALGGLLVILFLSGILSRTYTLIGNTGTTAISDESVHQDAYVSDTLKIERAERGQSAREDSILVSFLQYSL